MNSRRTRIYVRSGFQYFIRVVEVILGLTHSPTVMYNSGILTVLTKACYRAGNVEFRQSSSQESV